jgi:hypothetical protein
MSCCAALHRWQPRNGQKAVPLLLACGIDGSVPGDYNITFSITNSAGRRAVVRRQLKVKAVCPEGEQLCEDKVGRAGWSS